MTGSTKLALWVTAGFLAGGGAGYFVARATITAKIQAAADEEIDGIVKKFGKDRDEIELLVRQELYDEAVRVNNENETTEDLVAVPIVRAEDAAHTKRQSLLPYQEQLLQQGYVGEDSGSYVLVPEDTVAKAMALEPHPYDDTPSDQDAREEVDVTEWDRHVDKPYVIDDEEWADGLDNHEQMLLDYYEEDGTLCFEGDKIISPGEVQEMIGAKTLSQFGFGSKDKDIVYVRNCAREMDFEITRSEGSYSDMVLGVSSSKWAEYEDNDRKPIKKMRSDE